MSALDFYLIPVCKIELYLINGSGGNRNKTLFVSFPFYLDEPFIKIKVG